MAEDGPAPEAPSNPLDAPTRFARDSTEFGRALGFFDATFAIAATLLVVTLTPESAKWTDFSSFLDAEWPSLLSFAISFVVICVYWWANHRLVATLDTLSSRFVFAALGMLAFVVLLPFTTGALGDFQDGSDGRVATVVYAINVILVSLATMALVVVAERERLYRTMPTHDQVRGRLIGLVDTPIVFLLSIPVTVLLGTTAGRCTWLLLVVTGNITGRIDQRVAAGPGSTSG